MSLGDWLHGIRTKTPLRTLPQKRHRQAPAGHTEPLEVRMLLTAPALLNVEFAENTVTTSSLYDGTFSGSVAAENSGSGFVIDLDQDGDGTADQSLTTTSDTWLWSVDLAENRTSVALRVSDGIETSAWETYSISFSGAASGSGSSSGSASGSTSGGTGSGSGSSSGGTIGSAGLPSWLSAGTLTFDARDDYYAIQTRDEDSETVLDVLGNDTHDGAGELSITALSASYSGAVRIVHSATLNRDVLIVESDAYANNDLIFTYTISTENGDTETANVTVWERPVTAAETSNSSIQPLIGNGLTLSPTQSPNLGITDAFNFTTSTTDTITMPMGGRTGTGDEGSTTTITSTIDPLGNWTYTEVLIGWYDVQDSDGQGSSWHYWGLYNYSFTTFSMNGTSGYTFVLTSDDFYNNTVAASSDSPSGGVSGSQIETGHQFFHADLGNWEDVNTGASIGHDWQTTITTNDAVGGGTYWSAMPGGSANGNYSFSGGGFEFQQTNLNFAQNGAGWLVVGITQGSGSGSNGSNYMGSGSYGNANFAGTMSEGGRTDGGYQFGYFATLNSALSWTGTGSGQSSGSSSSSSRYSGTGTYTAGSQTPQSGWTGSGSNRAGGRKDQSQSYSLGYTLGGNGWAITSGTASASGSSSGSSSYSGTGQYWRLENGGRVDGSMWESGSAQSENDYSSQSQYANGTWVTTGTASGSASGSSHFSYTGTGDYVDGVVAGSTWENGSKDGNDGSMSQWTLINGQWALTGGSGSGSSSSQTSSSFSGTGVEHQLITTDTYYRQLDTQRWQSGGRNSSDSSWTQSAVVNGAWQTVDGGGSGSGSSSSHASNSASGWYSYEVNDGSITGSLSGSGAEDTSASFQTTSVWNGTGWTTTGSNSASASGRSDSSYSGSGGYSRNIGAPGSIDPNTGDYVPPATGDYTYVSGEMSESGGDNSSWSSESVETLNAAGKWVLSSGSGSSSGSSKAHFEYSGTGNYRTSKGSNPNAGTQFSDWTVSGSTSESGSEDTDGSGSSQSNVVGTSWVTSATNSSTTTVRSASSASGTGTYTWDDGTAQGNGSVSSSSKSNSYTKSTLQTVTPAGGVATTTGSATTSGSSMTDFQFQLDSGTETRGGITYDWSVYLFDRTSSQSDAKLSLANGTWGLTSGSATNTWAGGAGQAESGSGTVTSSSAGTNTLGEAWSYSETRNVTKDDRGSENAQGNFESYNVQNGAWAQTDMGQSNSGRMWENYEDDLTGTYSRGAINGDYSGGATSNYDHSWSRSVGTATGSNSGSVNFSFDTSSHGDSSGSGTITQGGTSGTYKESNGFSNSNYHHANVTMDQDGNWTFASGGRGSNNSNYESQSYSGDGDQYDFGINDLGWWDYSGTRHEDWHQGKSTGTSEDWKLETDGTWTLQSASNVYSASAGGNSSNSLGGDYSQFIDGGAIDGTYDSADEHGDSWSFTRSAQYSGGAWSHSGSGTEDAYAWSYSDYSGSGSYTVGDLSGSADHNGGHDDGWTIHKDWTLQTDGWYASGTGSDSGNYHWGYNFSASGNTTPSVQGGTLAGSANESGSGDYQDQFSRDYEWSSITHKWELTGGSGSGHEAHSYQSSGSASGVVNLPISGFGDLPVTVQQEGTHTIEYRDDWTYAPQGGAWTISGSGYYDDSSSGSQSLSGSATINGATLKIETGTSGSSNHHFDWTYDPTDSVLIETTSGSSEASGLVSYSASGSGTSTTSSTSTDGTETTVTTSNWSFDRSFDEQFLTHNGYSTFKQTSASGEITSSSSWGDASASGSAHNFTSGSWSSSTTFNRSWESGFSSWASGGTIDAHDHYQLTAGWNIVTDPDGTITMTGSLSNQQSGDRVITFSYLDAWQTTFTYPGSSTGGGGGGGYSYTTGGGSSGSGSSSASYSQTSAFDFRFREPSWTDYQGWLPTTGVGGASVGWSGGNGTFVIPGSGNGNGTGGGSATGGGGGGGGGGGNNPTTPSPETPPWPDDGSAVTGYDPNAIITVSSPLSYVPPEIRSMPANLAPPPPNNGGGGGGNNGGGNTGGGTTLGSIFDDLFGENAQPGTRTKMIDELANNGFQPAGAASSNLDNLLDQAAANRDAVGGLLGDPNFLGLPSGITEDQLTNATLGLVELGASMAPGVGEAMDMETLADPDSTELERTLACASLGANAGAGGFLPNFGRSGKRFMRSFGGATQKLGDDAVELGAKGFARSNGAQQEVIGGGIHRVGKKLFADIDNTGVTLRTLRSDRILITHRGINVVENHLKRFKNSSGGMVGSNVVMLKDLRNIANGKLAATKVHKDFYAHELREFVRYRNNGFATGDAPKSVYRNNHYATLSEYGIPYNGHDSYLYTKKALEFLFK